MNIKLLEMTRCADEEFIENAENQIFLKENIKKHQESKKKFQTTK